jgi:hypothetical protein
MSTGLQMKYFVLKPRGTDAYASASRAAMFTYAKRIMEENQPLSKEIWDWATNEFLDAKEADGTMPQTWPGDPRGNSR